MAYRYFASLALGLIVGSGAAAAASVDPDLPVYVAGSEVSGSLTCAGGDTMQDLAEAWARGFEYRHPGSRIRIRHDTRFSAEGFDALMDGRVDCVTYVREPFAAELAAFKDKFGEAPVLVNVAGGSYATQGGTHALAIYVNAANPLRRLTLAQLDAILSKTRHRGAAQEITLWGQLGLDGEWANRPIHVYGMIHQRETGNPPGVVNYLQHRVLLDGAFRDDVRVQGDKPGEGALEAIVNRVAADPAGIGYSGFAFATPSVRNLALAETDSGPFYTGTPAEVARRDYPLSRRIYLMFKRSPDQSVQPLLREFVLWTLSREGQLAVAADRMRFIPLTATQAALARAAIVP